MTDNAKPAFAGTCEAPCSALDDLDWIWIDRACRAVGVTPRREDAEEVVRLAVALKPMEHCERGVFRAIRWPTGQVEVLFTLSDITFTPNKVITKTDTQP